METNKTISRPSAVSPFGGPIQRSDRPLCELVNPFFHSLYLSLSFSLLFYSLSFSLYSYILFLYSLFLYSFLHSLYLSLPVIFGERSPAEHGSCFDAMERRFVECRSRLVQLTALTQRCFCAAMTKAETLCRSWRKMASCVISSSVYGSQALVQSFYHNHLKRTPMYDDNFHPEYVLGQYNRLAVKQTAGIWQCCSAHGFLRHVSHLSCWQHRDTVKRKQASAMFS